MRSTYFKWVNIICLMFLLFSSIELFSIQIGSSRTWIEAGIPYVHKYVGSTLYEGDDDGNFKGDIVILLDDGSSWKIHPTQSDEIGNWEIGDEVHIGVRTSMYFYKREHKFIICNHQKNSELKAMLLATPLTVHTAMEPQPTRLTYHGFISTYSDYKQNLILNNGDRWQVEWSSSNDTRFSPNTKAYVGYNIVKKDPDHTWISFFLIYGTGKEAKQAWVRPGNYTYTFN